MDKKLFIDLPLSPEIQKGLRKLKFTQLTPIQAEAIPLLLRGFDVIGQAQTGTGKTASFGVPLVMKINTVENVLQGLVITPTRELTIQVSKRIRKYARYSSVRVAAVYGGEKISEQMKQLNGAHVIVGTPGRVIDLIKRRVIDLRFVKIVVLDEADKMLEMGFIDDISLIFSKVPYVRQTSMWSATLDEYVIKYARRFMRHPKKVLVSKDEVAQTRVEQYYLKVESGLKIQKLVKLLDNRKIDQGIIFCNTRKTTEEVAQQLFDAGITVNPLHGKYSQQKREEVVNKFRRKQLRFLVASDVAARGLDLLGISHVFNYEVPKDPEIYFHRIGRTGRVDSTGISITFVSQEEEPFFDEIKSMTGVMIQELKEGKT
jgi:ATP-dependent RNA helicase DeaD